MTNFVNIAHKLHKYLPFIIFVCAFLMIVSPSASAAGGVGSGGDSTGGSGLGGWTRRGHGWALYNSNGSGPSQGFQSGSWSAAKKACGGGVADYVAVFVLGTGTFQPSNVTINVNGGWRGYNYKSSWDSFQGSLNPAYNGTYIDSGKARVISRSAAKNGFDQLKDYGISTTGFTWGSNVAWFCYGLNRDAVLDVQKGSDGSILVKNSFTYNLSIRAYDRINVGSATFNWRLDSRNAAGTWTNGVDSGSTTLSGTNPQVQRSPTRTYNSPGTYCFRLTITSKPGWARYNDQSQTQCVVVVAESPPKISASTPTCSSTKITGAAWDNDNFGVALKVTVTMKNSPGSQSLTANKKEANGNMHGYEFIPTSSIFPNYKSDSDAEFTFTAFGINPSGAQDGEKVTKTVLKPASCAGTPASPSVETSNYEKGTGGTVDIVHKITKFSCTNGESITWQITGKQANGINYNSPITSTLSTVASPTLPACSAEAVRTINGSYLDTLSIPGEIKYTSAYGSNPPVDGFVTVYEVPYARFYGADISSLGSGISPNGKIIFNTKNGVSGTDVSKSGDGSASEYAAIAREVISAARIALIDTAAFRATDPVSPGGLMVNASIGSADTVGYASELPESTAPAVDWSKNGYYDYGSTNAQLSANNIDKKVTVKANDIFITGNIITNVPSGVYDDSKIPIVLLIADGDIYIDKSVQQIDAILSAPSGTIYTCADTATAPYTVNRGTWQSECNKRLVVNGSVLSKNIAFQRSIGTRLFATTNEDNPKGSKINGSAGSASQAAEVFNYPAYLYFATPYLQSSQGEGKYDSLFNAPPRF